MIAYLLKNWKLFLDLILVVGGIIVFTLFDPFGMFSKRELKGTANIVSSVKGIGELVTAEYYGEVLSSLNETFVFDIAADTVSELFEDCLYELIDKCISLEKRNKRLGQILNSPDLKKLKTKYNNKGKIFDHLIVMAACNQFEPDLNKYYKPKKQELRGNVERDVIKLIVNRIKAIKEKYQDDAFNLNNELNKFSHYLPPYIENAAGFHYKLNEEALTRNKRRHDIVFIGRGWVKAGYKFKNLDERNFTYNESSKVITFYGLSPVILDKDINPWFVPEKKIEGFQLVDYYKGATFEEAVKVKIKCKEKLLEQAQKAGVMAQAQKNGKEALKNFFSLLMNEPNLQVKFEPIPNQNELNLIAADTIVTVKEALIIDTLIQTYKHKIAKAISPTKEILQQQLMIFYKQLTQLHFIDTSYSFNVYSIEAAKILEHKHFVLYGDYKKIMKVRDTLRLIQDKNEDTIYTNFTKASIIPLKYPDYVHEYNQMLECIDLQLKKAFSDTNITVEITEQKLNSLLANKIDDRDNISYEKSEKVVNGKVIYILKRKSSELAYSFSDLAYANYSVNVSFNKFGFQDSTLIKQKLDSLKTRIDYKTGESNFDLLRENELQNVILPYYYKSIHRDVSLKPIYNFINFVKKPFN